LKKGEEEGVLTGPFVIAKLKKKTKEGSGQLEKELLQRRSTRIGGETEGHTSSSGGRRG